MQINVNGSKINKTVSSVRSKTDTIDNLIKQFEGMIEQIPTYWSGEDANKYIDLMRSNCISRLKVMNEIMRDYTNYLDKVPEVYEILDESFSNRNINV